MSKGYELGTAKVFQDFSTPFNVLKTAKQTVQLSVDPNRGLTRSRYGWFSNGEMFDESHFSEEPGQIVISTGSNGSDTARIRSAFAGQYVSQAMGQPGHAVKIDSDYVNIDSDGLVSLTNGNVKLGAFMHDGSQVSEGFFLEYDTSGTRFVLVRDGSRVTEVSQEDWNKDTMTGQAGSDNPSGDQLDPSEMYIYNYPFTWYNSGRIAVGQSRVKGFPEPQQLQLWHEFIPGGEPNINTANLPVQVMFDNDGTDNTLSGSIGGLQYTIYGGNGPTEKRTTDLIQNDIDVDVQRNDPIDPPAEPGKPIFAVKRKDGIRDLEVNIRDIEIVPEDERLYFYLWHIYDESMLTDANFTEPVTVNHSKETKIEVDKEATALDTSEAVNVRTFRVSGSKDEIKESIFPEDAESRLPMDAIAVLTVVESDPNGNGTEIDVVMPVIEGF